MKWPKSTRHELGEYEVTVLFRLEGLVGREVFPVRYTGVVAPTDLAWFELERALIEGGVPTFECDCCVDWGHAQFEVLDVQVVRLGWLKRRLA